MDNRFALNQVGLGDCRNFVQSTFDILPQIKCIVNKIKAVYNNFFLITLFYNAPHEVTAKRI